jgi:hypothetical protein
MPNWCQNTLTITGPEAMIKKFMADAQDKQKRQDHTPTELSLEKLYPTPSQNELNNMQSVKPKDPLLAALFQSKPVDWYSWRVTNWGTKWDVEAWVEKSEPRKVVYGFDSAWSPPIDALTHISEDYPDLKFVLSYREDGMGFRGKATIKDGDAIEA